MNNQALSLGRFRSEIGQYKKYTLVYNDPLRPVSLSIQFDKIAVSLSASPYVALRNETAQFCISHIERIQKRKTAEGAQTFLLWCCDHSTDIPTTMLLHLHCDY